MKKYLALLLCLLLMLSAAGCLEKTEKAEADAKPAATDTTGGDVDASKTDELPAFTLGDFTVTVGEVRSSYNTVVEYMSYYGLTAPTTAEEIQQYRSMIIEDLLTAKVLPWKAQQMGIKLTEEKKEQVAQEVEELIAEYAGDYLDDAKSELGEDAGAAELALKAREFLEQDVEDYFGYPFGQWLEELTASYEENALTEMLQEAFNKGVTVTEEQARAWFEGELEDQKESFTEDYTYFKSQYGAYRDGESSVPALYTPEGFGACPLHPRGLRPDAGDHLQCERRRQRRLCRQRAGDDQSGGGVREAGAAGRKRRAAGGDPDPVRGTQEPERRHVPGHPGQRRQGPDRQEVWNAAVALKEGEVSELLQVGDTFYLIKRLSDLPAGTASFEDDAEAYTAAALAEQQQKEWDAVQEDWLSEARNAAVFYEENYAGVGVQ